MRGEGTCVDKRERGMHISVGGEEGGGGIIIIITVGRLLVFPCMTASVTSSRVTPRRGRLHTFATISCRCDGTDRHHHHHHHYHHHHHHYHHHHHHHHCHRHHCHHCEGGVIQINGRGVLESVYMFSSCDRYARVRYLRLCMICEGLFVTSSMHLS